MKELSLKLPMAVLRDMLEIAGSAPGTAAPRGFSAAAEPYEDPRRMCPWSERQRRALYRLACKLGREGEPPASNRRQALVPLHDLFSRVPAAEARLVDIACGTGRFLASVKENYPRLDVTAVDLSPNYLAAARELLRPWSRVRCTQAAAEALPLPDDSVDAVTCIYLFHELPRKIRAQAAAEFARVLKPGGRLVFEDSIQMGDNPPMDGLLELFPIGFHEPYYADFVRQDLTELFTGAGLMPAGDQVAFMSKILVFDKPA